MSEWLAEVAQTLGTILTLASCTALSRTASCWGSSYGMARMRLSSLSILGSVRIPLRARARVGGLGVNCWQRATASRRVTAKNFGHASARSAPVGYDQNSSQA
jgi:hypothetical protein